MKHLLAALTIMTISNVSLAATDVAAKCELNAKSAALSTLQAEDTSSGLNENVKPTFTALNNGGVYIVSGWIQRVFNWQVVVTVDSNCKIENAFLAEL